MGDREKLTYKKVSEKDMSSLVKAFRQLSPTKRQYTELCKSDSTSSVSSGSSFVSNSSMSMNPEPKGSSKYQSSSSKPGTSGLQKNDPKKEKELLQKLEKNVKDTSKTLKEYVAIHNRKK